MKPADLDKAWQIDVDDKPLVKRQKLDNSTFAGSTHDELHAAASTIVGSSTPNSGTGTSTPLTTVPQRGSGYATPIRPHVEVRNRPLIYPKSQYEGSHPPKPPTHERQLREELLQQKCDSDYLMVPISDFCIYRPQNTDRKHGDHSLEMEPLHVVMGYRSSCQSLLFDALVSTDCGTKYVRGVPFETLAIDAYDPDVLSAADHISIQSRCFAGTKIWYHLEGSPSSEYKRYHEAFLWVADLAKHVIAFMDERENTKLADFRLDFHKWLGERYNLQAPGPVQNWLSKLQGKDFRKAIVAQADFLWKECSSVNETLCNEPLWQEINIIDQTCSSEKVNKRFSAEEEIGTVVTPFVWRNFSQLPDIQKFMTQKTAVEVLNDCAEHRKSMMGFTNADKAQKTAECNKRTTVKTKTKIEKGDCVAIWADEESSWKDGAEIWYGYVQDVRRDRRGDRFNILWL
ncbi:uncharacterized protein BKA78DRAFT_383285 [Phyllosticta capitalensis]|uniref:uncharacterized protein n=1 Tax=Phyllosticta capitalensis TaxID=121624 RepID=UPI00312CEC07